MFKENDIVVYKREVCRVKEIKLNSMNNKEYYVLVPVNDESLIIDIPVDNKLGNLRKIIDKKEVEKIIKKIPNIEIASNINDKVLENEYKMLLNDGTHESLIKIIKTTYIRNKNRLESNRKIGEKDDAYFKKAENLLYTEFSYALGKNYNETKEYVLNKVEKNIKKS